MSLSVTGQHISCDGIECLARAVVPVALHPTLTGSRAVGAESVDGWLFVVSGGEPRHYCPACSLQYLEISEDCSSDQ